MNYDPYASDEESNSREDPGGCPLNSGSITALWVPPTSVRWHEQTKTAVAWTNSLFCSWVPSVGLVHTKTLSYGQGNIAVMAVHLLKENFLWPPPSTCQTSAVEAKEANKQRRGQQS